jgi:urocanate hydratase
MDQKTAQSIAYIGNVVDLWERLADRNIRVDLGSDQTSLHNPWAGGYYPVGLSFADANDMMAHNPENYKEKVRDILNTARKYIDGIEGELK